MSDPGALVPEDDVPGAAPGPGEAPGTGGSVEPGGISTVGGEPALTFRVMDVLDVALDLPAQFPTVTLMEAEHPYRQLMFPIGLAEGTALAHALRGVATPRPLTHELVVDVLRRFNIDVVAVRLLGRTGGTYLAELDLMGQRGREVVPCRPSDGLTLALRLPVRAPILADERLLDDDGDVAP